MAPRRLHRNALLVLMMMSFCTILFPEMIILLVNPISLITSDC